MSLASLKKPLLLAIRSAVAEMNGAPVEVKVSTAGGRVKVELGEIGKPINKAHHYKVDQNGVSFSVLMTEIMDRSHYTDEARMVIIAAEGAASDVLGSAGLKGKAYVTFARDADDDQVRDLRATWLKANLKPAEDANLAHAAALCGL